MVQPKPANTRKILAFNPLIAPRRPVGANVWPGCGKQPECCICRELPFLCCRHRRAWAVVRLIIMIHRYYPALFHMAAMRWPHCSWPAGWLKASTAHSSKSRRLPTGKVNHCLFKEKRGKSTLAWVGSVSMACPLTWGGLHVPAARPWVLAVPSAHITTCERKQGLVQLKMQSTCVVLPRPASPWGVVLLCRDPKQPDTAEQGPFRERAATQVQLPHTPPYY